MSTSDHKAQRVGAAVLVTGMAAAVALILFEGIEWRRSIEVHVYMSHAGPLSEGDSVIVAGRDIGRVEDVSLAPSATRDPDDTLTADSGVVLRVSIEERYAEMTSVNSEIFMERQSVLGRPYLTMSPPPPEKDWVRPLEDGDRVRGVDPARIDRILRRVMASAAELRAIGADIEPSIRELSASLSAFADTARDLEPAEGVYARSASRIGDVADELDTLSRGLEEADVARVYRGAGALAARTEGELGEAKARLDAALEALSRAHAEIPPGSLDRVRGAVDDASAAVAAGRRIADEARQLAMRIDSGRGTVGAILRDPAFARDARELGRMLVRQPWRVLGRPPDSD